MHTYKHSRQFKLKNVYMSTWTTSLFLAEVLTNLEKTCLVGAQTIA